MIILFIINPNLKCIPAQNLGGEGWTKKRQMIGGVRSKKNETKEAPHFYPHGEVKVSFESDGTDLLLLASIVATTAEGQTRCRAQFATTTGELIVAEMPPTLGERKAAQAAVRQRRNTL